MKTIQAQIIPISYTNWFEARLDIYGIVERKVICRHIRCSLLLECSVDLIRGQLQGTPHTMEGLTWIIAN
jgi:hypothetical protein